MYFEIEKKKIQGLQFNYNCQVKKMEQYSNSKNGFKPYQPSISNDSSSGVSYREYQVSDKLRKYVHCIWILKSNEALSSPFAYKIVSDGCVDLLIDCSFFEGAIITGTTNTHLTASLDSSFEYFGIRFLPGAFTAFFDLSLKEIVNQMVFSSDIFGKQLSDFENIVFESGSTAERISYVEDFLFQRLIKRYQSPDPRFEAALHEIIKQKGAVQTEKIDSIGISVRQLRRFFDHYIGFSPKVFSRIVRFQSVLQAMKSSPKDEWGSLCYDYGYYDQAHFIKDFKSFSGTPPLSATV